MKMTGVTAVSTRNYACIDAVLFHMGTLWAAKCPKAQLARSHPLHETSALRTQVAFGCFRGEIQKCGHIATSALYLINHHVFPDGICVLLHH